MRRWLERLGGGWSANIVVGVAMTLISPAIGAFMRSPKLAIYGAAAGLTILLWIGAYHWAQVTTEHTSSEGTAATLRPGEIRSGSGVPGATLLPPQERLLHLLATFQRRFATSKLVVDRRGRRLYFDGEAHKGADARILEELYGAASPEREWEFERLVESMPAEYLRVFPEARWDNPFVLAVTEQGMQYLNQRLLTDFFPKRANSDLSLAGADFAAAVRAEAARSPKAALSAVSPEIERHLRPFAAATGFHHRIKPNAPLPDVLDALAETWPVSPTFRQSARAFWDVRELVIRGYDVSDSDVLRAVESGLLILRTLQGLQREKKVVLSVGVELFADAEGGTPLKGVWGVILENTSSDGKNTKSLQVFPSTRTDYQAGDELTWDFDMSNVYNQTWYREPGTGQIKRAWTQSAEFIGRPLQDVNRLPR